MKMNITKIEACKLGSLLVKLQHVDLSQVEGFGVGNEEMIKACAKNLQKVAERIVNQ